MFGTGPFGEVIFGDPLLFADNDGPGPAVAMSSGATASPVTDCMIKELNLNWECDV